MAYAGPGAASATNGATTNDLTAEFKNFFNRISTQDPKHKLPPTTSNIKPEATNIDSSNSGTDDNVNIASNPAFVAGKNVNTN
eukprot:13920439-Ditylum_brightwellii.AAC.1